MKMEDRAVSLNAVLSEIGRWIGYLDDDMIMRIQTGIKRLPSVTPKTGHWILLAHELYACSKCHSKWTRKLNYCPYCGTDMRGDEDGR